MTYLLTFVVMTGGKPMTLTTQIAGCADQAAAERKLANHYPGLKKVNKCVPVSARS